MRTVNLVDFSELLLHATTIGYMNNVARKFLLDDGIYPQDGDSTIWLTTELFESYIWNGNVEQPNYSEDTCKIMLSFFKVNNVNEIEVTK